MKVIANTSEIIIFGCFKENMVMEFFVTMELCNIGLI